ncbi:hypothetical protein EDB19DRAFT_2028247 [Suillus lakei]|nr:hypothetical protein EDB19DRAFT_2028247 [Suillus lakei]
MKPVQIAYLVIFAAAAGVQAVDAVSDGVPANCQDLCYWEKPSTCPTGMQATVVEGYGFSPASSSEIMILARLKPVYEPEVANEFQRNINLQLGQLPKCLVHVAGFNLSVTGQD